MNGGSDKDPRAEAKTHKSRETAALEMATAPGKGIDGAIDVAKTRELLDSVRRIVGQPDLNVGGKLRTKEFPEAQLLDAFAEAAKLVFDDITNPNQESKSYPFLIRPEFRAEIERDVQEGIKTHVSGFLRDMHGSVRDSIFDMRHVNDPKERERVINLRIAYIVTYVADYLENTMRWDAFSARARKVGAETRGPSRELLIKRVTRYLPQSEFNKFLNPAVMRHFLKTQGFDWDEEKVSTLFSLDTVQRLLGNHIRSAESGIVQLARFFEVHGNREQLVSEVTKRLQEVGESPPTEYEQNKLMFARAAYKSAVHSILSSGDYAPLMVAWIREYRKLKDGTLLAHSFNEGFKKRSAGDPLHGASVDAEKVQKIISDNTLTRYIMNFSDVAAEVSKWASGTKQSLFTAYNQAYLERKYMEP